MNCEVCTRRVTHFPMRLLNLLENVGEQIAVSAKVFFGLAQFQLESCKSWAKRKK